MNGVIRDGALRYVRSLEATCDVTIICQHNVKLMAHKIVLGIGSSLLQDILLDCHSCQNMTILLPQISSKLISLVLDFVYNGSIIITTKNDYKDFLEVAQMLKLHSIDIKSDTDTSDGTQYKKRDEDDIAKSPSNMPVDIRDESKDNLKEELSATDEVVPSNQVTALVPLVSVTHIRRVKEVRNKVLPSPWKARSPRHVIDWSYGQCRTRYTIGCMNRMNDSNNNVALPEEQPPLRKDDNVSSRCVREDVLSLAGFYHPAANTREIQSEEATDTRSCNINYDQNLSATFTIPVPCNNEKQLHRNQKMSSPNQSRNKPSTIQSTTSQESAKMSIQNNEITDKGLISNVENIAQDKATCSKTVKTRLVSVAEVVETISCNNRSEDDKRTKLYTCNECSKTFTQLRNYKYHRSIHDGSGEFAAKCGECGKTFNDRGYLRSHMKIHTDKKEYACNVCPKRFNQRVAYNMHLRIHTGVKPHECSTCGKSFSRKMLLTQHERVHTGEKPFVCPKCAKSFADRSNMMLHARLHTGEKPYTCNICQKSFTKKHHLKTHLNFHTGIKPYTCKNCGLTFSQSSNMKTHFKKCCGNGGNDALKEEEN